MPDSNVSRPAVVALPADLIFGARIRASAENAGTEVIIAKTPEDLVNRVAATETRLVILDLDRRGLDISNTVKQLKATSSATILAYVSHVAEDAIREAREAGADKVIARGAFAKQLAELLKLYNGTA
jgi:DNA-binding response OmpR family regulator